jgi:hypothetical protein
MRVAALVIVVESVEPGEGTILERDGVSAGTQGYRFVPRFEG